MRYLWTYKNISTRCILPVKCSLSWDSLQPKWRRKKKKINEVQIQLPGLFTHKSSEFLILKLKLCPGVQKLDRVGPADIRPSYDWLQNFVKKKIIKNHVSCNIWHWHRICKLRCMTFGVGWTLSKHFSSLALSD